VAADKAVVKKVLEKSKINPPLGFQQQSLAFVAWRFETAGVEKELQMRCKLGTVVGKTTASNERSKSKKGHRINKLKFK
jgi:hypothetical protein